MQMRSPVIKSGKGMDLSPYLRHLSLIVRVGTTLDHRTASVRPCIILWVAICCSAVTVCNTVVYARQGLRNAVIYGQTYDTFLCLFLLSHIPILLRSRSELTELVDMLLSPFPQIPLNTDHQKIITEYVKCLGIFGGVFIFNNFFVLCCLSMVLGPLVALPFYPKDTAIADYPLPMGRIPFQTDSHWMYALAYLVSASAIISVVGFYASWFLIMIYSSLKIKALLQMLSSTILSLDSRVAAFNVTVRDFTGRDSTASEVVLTILRQAVLFHLDIIEYVRKVQNTFRLSLLLYFQLAIIICALLLHNIINAPDLTLQNYLVMGNITFAATFSMGVYCFCGQNIISESVNLRWALYECTFSVKPIAIKRFLLIMMTVSSRPLRCIAGGVFPLSMVSYGRTLRAIYSYVNLLFTMRRKQLG